MVYVNVSIIARNKQRLKEVQQELKSNFPSQWIEIVSLDISKIHHNKVNTIQYLQDQLSTVKHLLGPIKVLIHCAGYSSPSRVCEIPEKEICQIVLLLLYLAIAGESPIFPKKAIESLEICQNISLIEEINWFSQILWIFPML